MSQYIRGNFAAASDKDQSAMETDGDEAAKPTEVANGSVKSSSVTMKVCGLVFEGGCQG